MSTKLKSWIAALAFVASFGGVVAATALPQTAAAAGPSCAKPILTFPVWYRNLPTNADCSLQGPAEGKLSTYIWIIVLNIIEIGLQVVGYLSAFFIIYGGFQLMTSAGSAEGTVKARKTITNAVIGLMISILSVAIVNFIAGAIS